MEIKNLKKAAQRIRKAIKDKENIILFSDADLDGTTSLIILEESIKSLGGKVVVRYFPDREKEGYGLSETALEKFPEFSPGLLILADSGIADFKEIRQANKMGFKTIIIDHHEILNNKLPLAEIIVDPKLKADNYPFKLLAACGLCLKLAKELLGKQFSPSMEQSFLELVALGTIADMMPETDDNLTFIAGGLNSLLNSLRPGIRVFLGFFGPPLSARDFAQKLISVLQLSDFQGNLTESYLVLSSQNLSEAQKLASQMVEKSQARHQLIKITAEQIAERVVDSPSMMIFEGGEEMAHLLTGSIASKLCHKFKKPTFIIASKTDLSRGSARSPKDLSCLAGLNSCRDLLKTYGGHPQAAGFTVENKNIEKLKECLAKYFANIG